MVSRSLVLLALFAALVTLFFGPLFSSITTHTTSINDGALIVWLSQQSADAVLGKGDWYNWPFFYPYQATSTYSDPLISAGLFLIIIRQFTANFILQYILLLLIALIGNFWGMYLLTQKLWRKTLASIFAATIFTFSFTQYQFSPHLHSFMLFGIPLGLWAMLSYLDSKKWYFAVLWAACYILQSLNAPMTGYFFTAILLIFIFGTKNFIILWHDYFFRYIALFVVFILCWYYLPYLITAQTLHAARTIRDTAHFSYPLEKLASLDLLSVLLPYCLYLFVSPKNKSKTDKYTPAIITSCIIWGAVCMLGPVVKVGSETFKVAEQPIPLPYAALYYLIPGMQAFRSVSRWAVVLNFGLALAAGWLTQQQKKQWLVLLYFGGYVALNHWLVTTHYYSYTIETNIPEIYKVVQQASGTVLAEFPMYTWDMGEVAGRENQRLIYQLYHGKILYNGVSGLTPPQRLSEILYFASYFPDDTSLVTLQRAGVDLLLVHGNEFSQQSTQDFQNLLRKNSYLELVSCTADNDCLYTFTY